MEIGINLQLHNINQSDKLSGYDFIELGDFWFPQHLCRKDFMDNFHKTLTSNKYNIKCIQGPIRDIKPEADDPDILKITKDRFKHLIDLAAEYEAKYILFNTTFDPLVKFDSYISMWLNNNKKFWEELIPYAQQNKVVCLYSNVWDDEPYLLNELLNHINSEYFKFGFDIGHARYISKAPLEEWFKILDRHIDYALIHDNLGQRDDHLSIGRGTMNFDFIMEQLKSLHNIPDLCVQLFDDTKNQECLDMLNTYLRKHNIKI